MKTALLIVSVLAVAAPYAAALSSDDSFTVAFQNTREKLGFVKTNAGDPGVSGSSEFYPVPAKKGSRDGVRRGGLSTDPLGFPKGQVPAEHSHQNPKKWSRHQPQGGLHQEPLGFPAGKYPAEVKVP